MNTSQWLILQPYRASVYAGYSQTRSTGNKEVGCTAEHSTVQCTKEAFRGLIRKMHFNDKVLL